MRLAWALVLAGSLSSCGKKVESPQARLFKAAATGDTRGAMEALAMGARTTDMNGQLRTPLHLAAENDQEGMILLLLERDPQVDLPGGAYGSTPLMMAAYAGHEVAAFVLVRHGAKVNAENEAGHTPLGLAALGGHAKMVEGLIAMGAKVDQRNRAGETALLQAAEDDRGGAGLAALLKKGADPDAKDAQGKTALQRARAADNAAAVELLLEAGAKN